MSPLGQAEPAEPGAAEPGCHQRFGSRMRGRAHVVTSLETAGRDRRPRSRLTVLRSEAPLVLRPTIGKGDEPWVRGNRGAARVTLTAAAAGPIGGDQLDLAVEVGAGSTLVLTEVSHTLLLPSHDRATSTTVTRITVERGGTLVWLPEPIIAARGCSHVGTTDIAIADGARLLAREELLLGRHGEPPGRLQQRIRVTAGKRPLYQQDLLLGDVSSRTPAVAGEYRAVGSVLVVDPDWTHSARPAAQHLTDTAALMPLASGAVLISGLAADNLDLRAALDRGVAALGPPWNPHCGPDD